jgi:hypothetical protein
MMKKTEFVTKDNVHEATNLEKIKSLMANAERLGDDEVVKRCNARLLELTAVTKNKKKIRSKEIMIKIPNIDYKYWASNHTFYSKLPFETNNTTKIGLEHAERGGLINAREYKNAEYLLDELKGKIQQADLDQISTEEILTIFDLIQGWGGKMGKLCYWPVKGKLPLRISNPKDFANNYLQVVKELTDVAAQDKLNETTLMKLVKSVEDLDRIGLNFGSKHFFFWSWFRDQKNFLYIYDTRMKAILKALTGKNISYYSYLTFLENIEKTFQLDRGIAERGIFAFSNNFYTNRSPLKLKSLLKIQDDYQIEIANTLIKKT